MKYFKSIVWIMCALAMVLFFDGSFTVAQAETVKITYSHFLPASGHPVAESIAEWAKEVEKRTNGKVAIRIYPSNTLTPAPKVYDGVVKGISGMGFSALPYTKGRFPLMEVLDLPLGFENALIATRLANAFYKKFQPKEFNDTKVMYFQAHGPGLLHTKKPVRSLEDLKGLRIRSTGASAKIVSALGATPVAMPMGETYDALAKGLVDGSVAPIASLYGFKWGEVVKYTTEDFGASYSNTFFVVMNKKIWNSLPGDVQQTIEKLNVEWIDKTGRVWDYYDKKGLDFVNKLGNQIISLSKEENERWAQRCQGVMDNYIKYAKERGLPGEEALKFCLDFVKNQ